jgi:hypothetical protein
MAKALEPIIYMAFAFSLVVQNGDHKKASQLKPERTLHP